MVAFYIMLARPVGRFFTVLRMNFSDANSWGHLWTAARQGRSQDFISTETKGWTGGLGTEPPVGWTGCLGSAIRGI